MTTTITTITEHSEFPSYQAAMRKISRRRTPAPNAWWTSANAIRDRIMADTGASHDDMIYALGSASQYGSARGYNALGHHRIIHEGRV